MSNYWHERAVISPCGWYRTWLQRPSSEDRTVFVMLNPSTADAEHDDATIRRCKFFATREGKGSLVVVNLFSLRSRNPEDLWGADTEPVGPDNEDAIQEAIEGSDLVICAWGTLGRSSRIPKWFRELREQMIGVVAGAADGCGPKPLYALGLCKDGSPRHPLYVRSDAPLVRLQSLQGGPGRPLK